MASDLVTAALSTGGALFGAMIGGSLAYYNQKWSRHAELDLRIRSLAAAIAAELEAYLYLMNVRQHHIGAFALAERVRAGSGEKLRGFKDKGSKPLDEFLVINSQLPHIGILGPICFDLVKFYGLVAGVQGTVISAEDGKYDNLNGPALADLIELEVRTWREALSLAETSIIPSLKKMARIPTA